jgi:hypothetical protein
MNNKTIVTIIATIYAFFVAMVIYNGSQDKGQAQELIKNIKISPEALCHAKLKIKEIEKKQQAINCFNPKIENCISSPIING